ncbi:DUF3021 domain-containing protein [Lederbergia galactosidilytica]|uniref:DUF3021 domain-containing protein n=1 Tax=Lederbergia galactosidilytica TaxID=217031 RepID=A0A0Q9Y7V6_9BACI|nr:DUF3021 domain-containing protein [Lederbergia galactosidilytica]KRG14875.1 hypothetical protein ACA30_09385 [Virgibacillus soli]KRG16928.1 hypothetical protein ACA29_02405 [Lederbergia galactosidilytica]MBP1914554.1 hypothetical protein [Lederbergia galactosidilytica]OAK69124.1 hypothetical protein ABB05_14250 [Lederbergia galactosidilytica]
MKKFLFQSVMGILFGAFMAVLLTNIIYFKGADLLDGQLFLKNSLACLFCGWFFSVTPLFFEIKSLKLPLQTALHFVSVAILYFILSFSVGWIPFNLKSALLFAGLFLLIYACIWIGFYLYFRNEAKKLNDDLLRI